MIFKLEASLGCTGLNNYTVLRPHLKSTKKRKESSGGHVKMASGKNQPGLKDSTLGTSLEHPKSNPPVQEGALSLSQEAEAGQALCDKNEFISQHGPAIRVGGKLTGFGIHSRDPWRAFGGHGLGVCLAPLAPSFHVPSCSAFWLPELSGSAWFHHPYR